MPDPESRSLPCASPRGPGSRLASSAGDRHPLCRRTTRAPTPNDHLRSEYVSPEMPPNTSLGSASRPGSRTLVPFQSLIFKCDRPELHVPPSRVSRLTVPSSTVQPSQVLHVPPSHPQVPRPKVPSSTSHRPKFTATPSRGHRPTVLSFTSHRPKFTVLPSRGRPSHRPKFGSSVSAAVCVL